MTAICLQSSIPIKYSLEAPSSKKKMAALTALQFSCSICTTYPAYYRCHYTIWNIYIERFEQALTAAYQNHSPPHPTSTKMLRCTNISLIIQKFNHPDFILSLIRSCIYHIFGCVRKCTLSLYRKI